MESAGITNLHECEVVIIGAGPAGIAAAIQLKRQGVEHVLLERTRVGGLLWHANLIENYPGFAQGVRGNELVELLKAHLKKVGVNVNMEEVESLGFAEGAFLTRTNLRTLCSKFAVVASGTMPVALERHAKDDRIHYDFMEIVDLKGQKIVIIGAGDAAFDYALNLARNNQVMILNRSSTVKCLRLLKERAEQMPSISYVDQVRLSSTVRTSNGLKLVCTVKGREIEITCDHLLVAIGRMPRTDFLHANVRDNIRSLVRLGRLYFAGDVRNDKFRQAAIACGDGLRAAMAINLKINAEK
jgi:thioredoxin reductase